MADITKFFLQLSYGLQEIDIQLLYGIGVALLTLSIPLGMYVLEEKNSISELDRNVKLKLISGKHLIVELFLLFIPLLFWNIVPTSDEQIYIRTIILISWLSGLMLIVERIVLLYKNWIALNDEEREVSRKLLLISSDVFQERIISSWLSLWENKKLDAIKERQYFSIFSSKLDNVISSNEPSKIQLIPRLLNDFSQNIALRNSSAFFHRGIFLQLLSWHVKIFEKEYSNLDDDNDTEWWSNYYLSGQQLERMVVHSIKRGISEYHRYSLFKELIDHVNKYQDIFVTHSSGKQYHYLRFLPIYQPLFELVLSSIDTYSFWTQDFPKDWKITLQSFKEKKIVRVWWEKYKRWIADKINQDTDNDPKLDYISEGLLPGINPITWAYILTYCFRNYSEGRLLSLIINPRYFGNSIGPFIDWEREDESLNFDEEIVQREDYTVKLAYFLLKNSFYNVPSDISELEETHVSIENQTEKEEILRIFKKIYSLQKTEKNE